MLISFWVPAYFQGLHPGRLTWNLQFTHLERKMIFQTFMRTCSMFNLWWCMLVSGSAFSSFFFVHFFFSSFARIRISPSGPSNPQLTVEYRVPWAKIPVVWHIFPGLFWKKDLRFRLIVSNYHIIWWLVFWELLDFFWVVEVLNLIYTVSCVFSGGC